MLQAFAEIVLWILDWLCSKSLMFLPLSCWWSLMWELDEEDFLICNFWRLILSRQPIEIDESTKEVF